MKNNFSLVSNWYGKYRSFAKSNRVYRYTNYFLTGVSLIYLSLLIFPQILFANQISHKNFNVYSREPLSGNMVRVLDAADEKLARSPIYNRELSENLIMSDSFGMYKFLTWSERSMGSTIPVLGHSRINKADIDNDLVFADREEPNRRSLSGVIAHETMHNQVRVFLGNAGYFSLPKWKDEGYCEYIAGETTLSFEQGKRLWQESPNDSSEYEYFKHREMVKYLLEDRKVSVEELLRNEFDAKEIEAQVFEKICRN